MLAKHPERSTPDDTRTPKAADAAETVAPGEVHRLHLSGRVLTRDSEEAGCLLRWVQGRRARVDMVFDSAARPAIGSRAILYLDLVGRVEGTVSRIGPSAIDVDIVAPSAKWLRLRQQFALLAAMAPAERENVRAYRRIALDVAAVALSLPDGRSSQADIQNVSRSGAAVRSTVVPGTGSIVTLGSTRGRVVRLLEGGFAVQFMRLLPLERFGSAYRL